MAIIRVRTKSGRVDHYQEEGKNRALCGQTGIMSQRDDEKPLHPKCAELMTARTIVVEPKDQPAVTKPEGADADLDGSVPRQNILGYTGINRAYRRVMQGRFNGAAQPSMSARPKPLHPLSMHNKG